MDKGELLEQLRMLNASLVYKAVIERKRQYAQDTLTSVTAPLNGQDFINSVLMQEYNKGLAAGATINFAEELISELDAELNPKQERSI